MAIVIGQKKTKAAGETAVAGKPWLLTGQAAKSAADAHEAQVEAAKDSANRMKRFWLDLEDNSEATITFLSGELDQYGQFEARAWEHDGIQHANRYNQFLCTKDQEPCPLCAAGNKPYLATFLSCINHSPYTIKKGPKAGTVLKNRKMLYVAKPATVAILTKLAIKRGGLTGCTFEISRHGDKEPKVGSMFEFVQKSTLEQIEQQFGKDTATPADLSVELTYYSAAELTAMGLGKTVQTIGTPYKGLDKAALENAL